MADPYRTISAALNAATWWIKAATAVFVCEQCGALVLNKTKHDEWHSQVRAMPLEG